MVVALTLVALLLLPPELGSSGSSPVLKVAVVRKPGVKSYEGIVEEIRGHVGAAVRVFSAKRGGHKALLSRLRAYDPNVVIAVGQSAYDEVRRAGRVGPVVHTLAYHDIDPAHTRVHDPLPPPRTVLKSLQAAKPVIKRVVLLHGPGRQTYVQRARAAAVKLGLELRVMKAATPARAVSMLRGAGPRTDALWLLPDIRLLTPQVFQYALWLQFRKNILLMAATRRHTRGGALFAVDYAPRALGTRAAAHANRILSGARHGRLRPLRPRLSVNRATARRIGAWTEELRRLASEVVSP